MRPGRLNSSDLRHALAAPRFDGVLVSEYVSVLGLRTHYRCAVEAPLGTTPVVCLHGLAVSHSGLVARFLRDVPRESPWQAPILLRDIWDAGPRRIWATLSHSVRQHIEDHLVKVTAPTMVIGGARDPIAPASWREHVARLTGTGHHETIPHAAHNVTTTAAAEVTGLITLLLNKTDLDR